MDAVTLQQRYLKLTKAYLLLTGMWPNQNNQILPNNCGISYIWHLQQVARVVRFFSLTVLIQQLGFLLGGILLLAKQSAYVGHKAKFETLLHGMFNDWEAVRPKEEVAIMTSYMDRGAFIVLIYAVNVFGCTLLFINMPWLPRIADILMPLNTSRDRLFIIPACYFVDENKYYYWIIAHMTIIIITAGSVYIACDTCFIYIVQHACGLLGVAGYRFKEAVDEMSKERKIADLSNETYMKVRRSVQGHVRALRYLRDIDDVHASYLLACLGIVTAAFSATLALLSELDICLEFYQGLGFLVVQLMHLFFLTLHGEFVIESNDKAYNQIYEGLWYNAAPKAQALYVLALRASAAAPQITAGGQIPMNLETFAVIIKASVSYFTMLKST
nr:PREDICTED: uncharacterized protein LOC100880718 [Megachile rotundata]